MASMGVLGLVACPRKSGIGDGTGRFDARVTPLERGAREDGIVDTHLHIAPTEVHRAIAIMDAVGIRWGLNLSGLWPGGPLEEQLEAARQSGRLLVACNLPWALARRRRDFPDIAVELLAAARQLGARAFKVEKVLGLAARRPEGTLLSVDDPWLDPIWSKAGELGLTVVIHTGDPKAFWLPLDEKNERFEELSLHPGWSNFGDPELPSFLALRDGLIRVVARHPKTTFVSVHFGNNAEDPEWVGRMLDTYPNLYIDIAARLPEVGRHSARLVHDIFVRHAHRILFATDTGVSPPDHLMLGAPGSEPSTWIDVKPYFDAHFRWLESSDAAIPSPTPIQGRWPIHGIRLPDNVLKKVYRDNAARLFGPPPAGPPAGPPAR